MPADSYRTFIELVMMPVIYTSWILSLVFSLKMLENNGIIVLGAFGIWSFPHPLEFGRSEKYLYSKISETVRHGDLQSRESQTADICPAFSSLPYEMDEGM